MKKTWWRVIAVAALAVVLVGAGLAAWRVSSARQTTAAFEGETAVVRSGTLQLTVDGTGSLVPGTQVALAFTSGGRVAEVLVEEGQAVEAGQPLLRLETDELALQVAQAEVALQQAELNLRTLQDPPDPADVQRAQDAVDEAAAALGLARIGYNSARDGVLPNETLEDAQSAYDEALNRYNDWLDKYNRGEADYWYVDRAQTALDDAQTALTRVRHQADQQLQSTSNDLGRAANAHQQAQNTLADLLDGVDESQVEAAQLQVDQARASLAQVQLRQEQAALLAPVSGTVTALNVEVGETIGAAQPAVVVSDLTALEVNINLDEADVVQIAPGQPAIITLDALPEAELSGEVVRIAPVAQVQSGVVLYPVTVRLAPNDLPVRAGMTAEVNVVTLSQENALIVPLRAVRSVDGQSYVLRQLPAGQIGAVQTAADGQLPSVPGFEAVAVTLGLTTDAELEIVDGLAEGDVVSVVTLRAQETAGSGLPFNGTGPLGVLGGNR